MEGRRKGLVTALVDQNTGCFQEGFLEEVLGLWPQAYDWFQQGERLSREQVLREKQGLGERAPSTAETAPPGPSGSWCPGTVTTKDHRLQLQQ